MRLIIIWQQQKKNRFDMINNVKTNVIFFIENYSVEITSV